MRSISLIILLSLFYILRLVDADPRGHLDMDLTAIEGGRADDQNGLAFSTTWHVLGPFKIGTRGQYDEATHVENRTPLTSSVCRINMEC